MLSNQNCLEVNVQPNERDGDQRFPAHFAAARGAGTERALGVCLGAKRRRRLMLSQAPLRAGSFLGFLEINDEKGGRSWRFYCLRSSSPPLFSPSFTVLLLRLFPF